MTFSRLPLLGYIWDVMLVWRKGMETVHLPLLGQSSGTVSLMTSHRTHPHRCQFSQRNWKLMYIGNLIQTLFCRLLWFSVAIVVLEVIIYWGHVKKCNVILTELSLCYSIVYYYNGVLWYEPFLHGRVPQLTGLTGLSIGPTYVRPVSCSTAFIAIQ